ncbi:MAG TPA: hypothetical protein VHO48_00290 [Anaerolineaceae bacterium]|nr:hypothetical protein [Anaerolineaceae bacterium]
MCLPSVSYRLATEPDFLNQLRQDLNAALAKAGIHANGDELMAIREYIGQTPVIPGADEPDDAAIDPWYPGQHPLPD